MMDRTDNIQSFAFLTRHIMLTGDADRPVGYLDPAKEKASRALWKSRAKFKQIRTDGKPNRRLIAIGGKQLLVSRAVWILANRKDIPVGMEVDHMNRDPLDDRPENLRLVDSSTNKRNSVKTKMASKELSSRYPGVSWNKRMGKWVTYLRIAGKIRYLGRYDDEIIAAHVVDAVKVYLLPSGEDLAHYGAACTEPSLTGISPESVWRFIGEAKSKYGIDLDAILARVAMVDGEYLSLAAPASAWDRSGP